MPCIRRRQCTSVQSPSDNDCKVTVMTRDSSPAIVSALVASLAAVVLLPAGAAQAQWYSSVSQQPAPLYPYAVDTRQPYAVEVAPNAYVNRRPNEKREAAYGRRGRREAGARIIHVPETHVRETYVPETKIARANVDPALIEELRDGAKRRHWVMPTTRVVRDKPVVVEHKRYVDDPPRVVERYTVVDDSKPAHNNDRGARPRKSADRSGKKSDGKRVIEADAEITILGPDRMNIRLFRKGSGGKANASAE